MLLRHTDGHRDDSGGIDGLHLSMYTTRRDPAQVHTVPRRHSGHLDTQTHA